MYFKCLLMRFLSILRNQQMTDFKIVVNGNDKMSGNARVNLLRRSTIKFHLLHNTCTNNSSVRITKDFF